MKQEIIEKIDSLCREGEALFNNSDYALAKQKYIEAINLVPEPENLYSQSTWIYVAIGDCQFQLKNYEKCFNCFYNAVQCPDGLGNPFIHLRLGQMYFEMGDYEKSVDELMRAYMGGGFDIFLEDDPKYIEFLESKVDLGMSS